MIKFITILYGDKEKLQYSKGYREIKQLLNSKGTASIVPVTIIVLHYDSCTALLQTTAQSWENFAWEIQDTSASAPT